MAHQNLPPPINLYRNAGPFREHSNSADSNLPPLKEIRPLLPSSDNLQYYEAPPQAHHLKKEATLPKYEGPAVSTKVVKIKPMDKEIYFNGSNITIEKFIMQFENAGWTDKASAVDLAKQIIFFARGEDLKDEI